MLDMNVVRENIDTVRQNVLDRNVNVNVDELLRLDVARRETVQNVELLRKERNEVADATKNAAPEEREGLMSRGKELKQLLAVKEAELADTESAWMGLLLTLPNFTHPDAPKGESDAENVEIRRHGEPPSINNPKSHVEIAEMHDLIDFERGSKVTGNKFYYLKGKLAILEQSLIRFALDELMAQGYLPVTTPDLVRDEMIQGAGFYPRGPESQIYSIENSDISLIGTSEHSLAGYHQGETLDVKALPIKYAGFSHCYRTEAGTYGRESYGLYRVHQFSKVEMFIFSAPDQSDALLHELVRIEEDLLQKLGLAYRVVDCCTADLGGPAYRKYDIEVWMPSKNAYGEITSASNCTTYQARRLGIKYKGNEGSEFVHTLNGTAIATSRAMLAILENHQESDGSVRVPQALVPYCGFGKINGS